MRLACVKHSASVRSEPGSNSQVHHPSQQPKPPKQTNLPNPDRPQHHHPPGRYPPEHPDTQSPITRSRHIMITQPHQPASRQRQPRIPTSTITSLMNPRHPASQHHQHQQKPAPQHQNTKSRNSLTARQMQMSNIKTQANHPSLSAQAAHPDQNPTQRRIITKAASPINQPNQVSQSSHPSTTSTAAPSPEHLAAGERGYTRGWRPRQISFPCKNRMALRRGITILDH